MAIVTFTTDLGTAGYALPALKGTILSRAPGAQLVDITHSVQGFDIIQAAFVFGHTWRKFPPGTIHVVWLNNYYEPDAKYLVVESEGHYIIGPDNGMLSLIPDWRPGSIYMLEYESGADFSLRNLYAFAVGHLVLGEPLDRIGLPSSGLLERLSFRPVVTASGIRGTVVYVDNFGNAVLNITRQLFEETGRAREFSLQYKRQIALRRLSARYSDVLLGQPLCLFNSLGLLEIAVYMENASTLLGLGIGDMVEVEFGG
jgi:S-adenosylmethionine hydrolase